MALRIASEHYGLIGSAIPHLNVALHLEVLFPGD